MADFSGRVNRRRANLMLDESVALMPRRPHTHFVNLVEPFRSSA